MKFLSLFPAFVALKYELQETSARLIAAQDAERLWRSRCDTAEAQRDKAEANADRNHKMIANYIAVNAGQPHVPYPEVFVAMPEPERVDAPQEPRRRQARDVLREAEAGFEQEYREMLIRRDMAFEVEPPIS